ncbi:MAG: NAD(P)-dependent glycerol-3-phosphate dehydrogenase [Aquiluna sp.]|nr:NAD(P)-dependent glycerol-3-phosphate dehydrogenase [Aquiluna sp.]
MGAGSWGTTIAKVIADAGNEVVLWSRREEVAVEINETKRNSDYLPGIDLPSRLTATSDLAFALQDAEQIYLAIPSQSLRQSLESWKEFIPKNATLISLIKGLEQGTGLRMSEVMASATGLPMTHMAVVSGPNLALEIAKQEPAASVCACADVDRANEVARTCSNDYFTVFTNQDVIGTELGGVLKNLIAVAIGIVNGLGHGQNTKASIMTRGLTEITKFAVAHGARRRTMFGLAGLGDLIATSESSLSRNFRAGEMLGQGFTKREVLKRMQQTAEGLSSVEPVLESAVQKGIEMPIVSQVSDVLNGRMKPEDFGRQLNLADDVEVEF